MTAAQQLDFASITEADADLAKMPARFLSKIRVLENGCWEWLACQVTPGYGGFVHERRLTRSHRVSYILAVGPIPDGLVMDHFLYPEKGCLGPICCNPRHVRPVTQRENILRSTGMSARHAAKTQCPQGHPYDAENTFVDNRGIRHCRECGRIRCRIYQARRRAT